MLTRRPKAGEEKAAANNAEAYNYISASITQLKLLSAPIWKQFQELQTAQQVFVGLLAAAILLGPLTIFSFFVPITLVLFVAIYCGVFGFSVFVSHFEAALKEHFGVSDEVSKYPSSI